MRTLRLLAVAALTLLGALGTAACRTARPPAGQQGDDQLQTTLRVDNQAFLDMTIYVVQGGQRIRLGNAGGSSTTVLTIPSYLLFGSTTLRFIADPIGAQSLPISSDIQVSKGDQVLLTIPAR